MNSDGAGPSPSGGRDSSASGDSVRIGHEEREKAADDLAEHFAQGRLEQAEFEERTGAAWQAKTVADLKPLFFDLPGGSLNGYLSSQATTGAERSARAPARVDGSEEVAASEEGEDADESPRSGFDTALSILMGIIPLVALALFVLLRAVDFDSAWIAFLLIPVVYIVGGQLRRRGGKSKGC